MGAVWMAGNDEKKPEAKPLGERLRDLVQGLLDELQALVNPPQPVRIPVTGSRRPR